MSKTKENPQIDFEIIQIEQAGTGMDIPEGFKPDSDYHYRIALESFIHTERKRLILTNRVEIALAENTPIIGWILVRYSFSLTGLEHLKQNKKGKHLIPPAIQLAVNSIALSTTRGMLFSQFRGTALHNAILPLIDVVDFSVSEAEE